MNYKNQIRLSSVRNTRGSLRRVDSLAVALLNKGIITRDDLAVVRAYPSEQSKTAVSQRYMHQLGSLQPLSSI